MNLPNLITLSRIALTPLIAFLPLVVRWEARLAAFVLFIIAAVSDWLDGSLARRRNSITPLGQLLDPLADKLLLLATLIPMYHLVGSRFDWHLLSPHREPLVAGTYGVMLRTGTTQAEAFPFLTPFGPVGLPLWIIAIVVLRELYMTVFRQRAARRGVIIPASVIAKWKTGFQMTWFGASYFWFFAATLATHYRWTGDAWHAFAHFNGIVVVVTMLAAIGLTLYSLAVYLRDYRGVFR